MKTTRTRSFRTVMCGDSFKPFAMSVAPSMQWPRSARPCRKNLNFCPRATPNGIPTAAAVTRRSPTSRRRRRKRRARSPRSRSFSSPSSPCSSCWPRSRSIRAITRRNTGPCRTPSTPASRTTASTSSSLASAGTVIRSTTSPPTRSCSCRSSHRRRRRCRRLLPARLLRLSFPRRLLARVAPPERQARPRLRALSLRRRTGGGQFRARVAAAAGRRRIARQAAAAEPAKCAADRLDGDDVVERDEDESHDRADPDALSPLSRHQAGQHPPRFPEADDGDFRGDASGRARRGGARAERRLHAAARDGREHLQQRPADLHGRRDPHRQCAAAAAAAGDALGRTIKLLEHLLLLPRYRCCTSLRAEEPYERIV